MYIKELIKTMSKDTRFHKDTAFFEKKIKLGEKVEKISVRIARRNFFVDLC